ncbi:dolichol-phosphate mannosyltransferase [Filimonas lacunae]|uniref:Dolichol-phosphate mannosyltransferase n=1 Tax=Filimonas lacunae TaxID=477680 RepID=A0A173MBG3_9BACT|nr:glycosyltransferase family 2 protein [Filimonas lacunae]BAV04850.1 glycosyltransferase [Filimonas lacunae]SIT34671.1 dolichol-phosphate mannosyltransferase [Filimonas lacunae]
MTTPLVSIVVPVHNEQNNVPVLIAAIDKQFSDLPYDYNLLFVDDGSTDDTVAVIKMQCLLNDNIRFISFSRNFGHQAALKAGLDAAYGDCVISMDGDMQHPPDLIPVLLNKWEEGYDVVYTLRQEDPTLSSFKRLSSGMFYRVINSLSEVKIESGSADFRLVSKKVVKVLREFTEADLFFRGLVKWAGFNQTAVEYVPERRFSGASKYTLKKMVRFALQGITSFSVKPLYVAIYPGLIISLLSVLYVPYAIYSYYSGHVTPGWASIIVTIAFFGGIQLMILGVIGLYLGKLFTQIKNRPVYLVKESNILHEEAKQLHSVKF